MKRYNRFVCVLLAATMLISTVFTTNVSAEPIENDIEIENNRDESGQDLLSDNSYETKLDIDLSEKIDEDIEKNAVVEHDLYVEYEQDENVISDYNSIDNDGALWQYLQQELIGEDDENSDSIESTYNKKKLKGLSLELYNALEEMGRKVASGEQTDVKASVDLSNYFNGKTEWTASEIGIDKIEYSFSGGNFAVTNMQEAAQAWKDTYFSDVDTRKIRNAVTNDHPEEFYWIALKYGYSIGATSYTFRYKSDIEEVVIIPQNVGLSMTFYVSADYADKNSANIDGNYCATDLSKIQAVSTSINNAKAIVASAAGKSDNEKLHYYMEQLCELTDYNHEAVSDSWTGGYGNPWQLIYMFDGNPATKVVCEGYSKAFQYLCDMTSFNSYAIYSYIVTGTMATSSSSGPHMWNVIHMDDGKQYLVDVTNCDNSFVNKSLFIAPASRGDANSAYYIKKYNNGVSGSCYEISYVYDNDTKALYSNEELTLSNTVYEVPEFNGITVLFDVNVDDANIDTFSKKVYEGQKYGTLPTPTKDGYTFEGWYDKAIGGSKITEDSIVSKLGDHTLYACWTANGYTVTFNGNGGTVIGSSTKTATYESAYGILPSVTREGYTFDGWYDSKIGGNEITADTTVTKKKNHTLYAHWTANKYTVTFAGNGGTVSGVNTKKVTFDSTYGTLATATKAGYSFDGWYTEAEGGSKVEPTTIVNNAANHTLYAHWTVKKYTVTFDGNEGTITGVNTKEVTYKGKYGELPTVAREGYTFDGWHDSKIGGISVTADTVVSKTSDHTLYAHWSVNEYIVTFVGNGGSFSGANQKKVIFDSTYGTLPKVTRTGYSFDGWYTEAEGGNKVETTTIVNNATNHTLYAHWIANEYTVTFAGNGGNVSGANTKKVTFDGTYGTLPTATRDDYAFVGWFDSANGGNEIKEESIVNKAINHTLYARWNSLSHSVRFNGNGGNVTGDDIKNVVYGKKYGIMPSATREGYTFAGWFDSEVEGNKITADTEVVVGTDEALYAHWTPNTYTVTFDANGGSETIPASKVVTYDSKYGDLPESAREGYAFIGWYTEEIDGTQVTKESIAKITTNQTLYAHWEERQYTVTFDANGGTVRGEQAITFKHGTRCEFPETVRAGYKLEGWFTEAEDGTQVDQNSDEFRVTKDQTLYAHWSIKYTVSAPVFRDTTATGEALRFETVDGKLIAEASIKKGSKVYLTSDTKGAKIYYVVIPMSATDTEDIAPSITDDNLYTDAIIINEPVTIKAVAVKDGYIDSSITTATYTLRDESEDWGDVTDDQAKNEIIKIKSDEINAEDITVDDVPTELWLVGVPDSIDYCGKAITFPELRVFKGKKQLVINNDYTIKYSNNIKAGTGTITVTGKGNYSGKIVKTFRINALDINDATANDIMLAFNNKVQKGTTAVTYELDGKAVTLKAKTDFTFVYPETAADAYKASTGEDASEGYEIQIVGKGNYTGVKTIKERITNKTLISKLSVKNVVAKPYTGQAMTQDNLEVWNGKVKLVGVLNPEENGNADYKVSYENNVEVGTATITITGLDNSTERGTYIGTKTVTFKINGWDIKKATFGKEVTGNHKYTGSEIKPINVEDSLVYPESKTTKTSLKGIEKSEYDVQGADVRGAYDYYYEYPKNITDIGTVKVKFTGINRCFGEVTKSYKIVVNAENGGTDISKMSVTFDTNLIYDGKAKEPNVTVFQKATSKTSYREFVQQKENNSENAEYVVTYENNVNAGNKATIIIKGVNNCTGTIKKSFTIKPRNLVNEYKVYIGPSTTTYKKGGVKPDITVKDTEGNILAPNNYTVSYSNNTKVHSGEGTKIPTVKVTGKGNYTGSITENFAINSSNLDNVTITAGNVTYQDKAGICKPAIKLVDVDGKALTAGTDYDKAIKYYYAEDVPANEENKTGVKQVIDAKKKVYSYVEKIAGDEVNTKDIIPVGTEIKAVVTGKGNYPGTKEVTFKYIKGDLSKATVKIRTQTFTGEPVTISKDDITSITVGKAVLGKTDYEIIGYSKNVAKGTATVVLRGIGNYGGIKNATFTISTKNMNYTVVYNKNVSDNMVTGTMKNSNISANSKVTKNAYSRKGYVFVGWSTEPVEDILSGESYDSYKDKIAIKDAGLLNISGIKTYGQIVNLYAVWKAN